MEQRKYKKRIYLKEEYLLSYSVLGCFKINFIFAKMNGYDRDSKFCGTD